MAVDAESIDLIGAGCLLSVDGRWVFEVQKAGKWLRRPGRPPVLGIGCIGGSLEPGETAIEALQREAREEINSEISLRSARETIDISPAGCRILSDFAVEGLHPAMIWEGSDPGFIPGLKVAVFLGDVDGDPSPGDLPAIVLADPRLVLEIGSGELTVGDLEGHGAEVRSKLGLPSNGNLQLQDTLRFVYDLHGTTNSLI